MKRTFSAVWGIGTVFMILFGFLLVGAPLIAFLVVPEASAEFKWYGIFPLAIFGFFAFVMIRSALNLLITYTISEKGIGIYRPLFHRKMILKEEIETVKLLSGEETKALMEASILEQNAYGQSGDLYGYIQMIKKNLPVFKYFTITTRARVNHIGPKDRITSLKVYETGSSIVLEMKGGHPYFLSPSDPEGFKEAYNTITTS